MAFQDAVATWFAVHILVRTPVGGRFGINNQALPVAIRLETGEGLDDIEVSQSDGGALHIQCKTRANLGSGPNAPLAKTVEQLARWVADTKAAGGLPDLISNVALLAVHSDAPRTLDNLESGCRAFDLGGDWAATRSQRNQAERIALGIFEAVATRAWTAHRGTSPDDGDLVDLARIFRVARFTMDEGDSEWREASRLLGRHLFGNETAGDAPLRDLKGIMRDLIGSGAPADRAGLLRALRRRGHHDIGAPGFEADVARLRAVTSSELARLAVHGRLPLGAGVPITRESDAPLIAAIMAGSLLVVGEPGAGKTGALVHAAALAATNDTVVFLSVDRFPGVAVAADLASELRLAHPVIETLRAMPGVGRKILIIDALDAARGGPSEAVFINLIEEVREKLADDWIVVASIRTFDLKNGRRFRQAFTGTPADVGHAEAELLAVRHFLIPRLSETDLAAAGEVSPKLGALLASASPRLTELLRNIFNLSLAAQLLSDGADPAAFGAIRTQSGLIDAYEDVRLHTTMLQQAAAAAAAVMASRRRLSVRKMVIGHAALDAVIQSGVLTASGDLVSFAHHVLFDHVAGRFHLEWNDPDALLTQLAGDTSAALLLAPALRFAVERLWRSDGAGRLLSWKLIIGIFSAKSIDPVLGNIALRIAVENIEGDEDVAGLMAKVVASAADPALAKLLARLARFAAMDIETAHAVPPPLAIAWARMAEVIVATGERALVDPGRVLLHALFDHGDLTKTALADVFGRAARALLELAWRASPPMTATSDLAIRFVGKSFASAPPASRSLLDQILREPHFSQHADHEATWLAEQILPITHVDPEFTVEVYAALYGQAITDSTASWFGGRQSRIMPLSSNRRQDYEHCRWQLGTAMGKVLTISPDYGTRALIDAVIGKVATRGYEGYYEPGHINLGAMTIELRGHDIEIDEEEGGAREDDLLHHYVGFLRDCDAQTFAASVTAASRDYATASVWARILDAGSERVDEVADVLWPLIERPGFLENEGTLRSAVRFVAAAWPSRTHEAHIRFESMALDETRFADVDERDRWRRILGRILAQVPEEALELDAMRALRRTFSAEGLLTENEPIYRFTTSWGGRDDSMRDELRRAGVDMDAGPHREVLDASNALHVHVERTSSVSPACNLAALWSEAMLLLALIDSSPNLNIQVGHSAWGHIANAVARVSSSPNYAPDAANLPDLATVFAILERLSSSHYPQPRDQGTTIHWGNLDVRVYAADAWVSLAPRFATEHSIIVDHLEMVLADAVPAVRLQAAQNLQVIRMAAPARMWAMAERIATEETNIQILAAYVGRPMRGFSHSDPERCETLLSIVKERIDNDLAGEHQGRDLLQEWLGKWTARLFVGQGRRLPRTWLQGWAANPERYSDLLNSFVVSLRGAFFRRYGPEADAKACAICDRAQEGLELILAPATLMSAAAYSVLASDAADADKQAAGKRYSMAEKVINHAMDQLFFGSGAYADNREDGPGLPDAAAMVRFLSDYSTVLTLLACAREPATLHRLIEVYEFLVPGDPVAVFEALNAILFGRGKEEGYQYESLGHTAVVRIVQRYIADYRAIFEDEGRRARLVAILQLFSEVGWTDALKLLYDLPDLLR